MPVILKVMGIGVEISAQQEGDVLVIRLDGRLDASTTPVVEKKVAKLVETSKKMVVDFTDVGYLSSAGMRLLLSITKKMQANGGQVAFFAMSEDVLEIIKMAGFERILKIFNTKNEALKSIK